MAIYRFETIGDGKVVSDSVVLLNACNRCFCNGYEVTKETHDRVLAELEANEAAAIGDDGWKPASEPPPSIDDVIVYSKECGIGIGYRCAKLGWHELIDGDYVGRNITHWHELPSQPPTPELPKEPEPVWQGPGWYEVNHHGVRFVCGCADDTLTRLIRLATDEELRHVCTHGTEPESKPEVDS